MKVSKEFIRCLDIEHDIMLLENQIKNLTQKRNELVKELECLKGQVHNEKKDIDIFCEFLGNVDEETKQEILNGTIQISFKFKPDGSLEYWSA